MTDLLLEGMAGDAPAEATVRFFRCAHVMALAEADLAGIDADTTRSAIRDTTVVTYLVSLGGDEDDLMYLIDLGDAFTGARHAWQAWRNRPAPFDVPVSDLQEAHA